MVEYRVRLADLDRHVFEAECRLADAGPRARFTLPSWTPGSYLLREYARLVIGVEASSRGRACRVEKMGKATWQCAPAERGPLEIRAEVYALDKSVRGAYLDERRAYFNGACLFLCPQGRENDPIDLVLEAPDDPRCASWRVATTMPPVNVDPRGFGVYRAADYEEVIDHPFEIGAFDEAHFDAAGVPHRFLVAGRHEADLERIAVDLRQLCETQIDFFGRPAPFERYAFLGLALGEGYGGLEHRASSSLIFSRDDLPRIGEPGVPAEYQRFLALASHEYFHSWNIKRIKPRAFVPYRFAQRNHTRLLWVFEGITSYYQELMLLRAGLVGVPAYLQRLGEMLSRVYRTPGRFRQSLAEASFDAWDVFYKPEPSSPNTSVSYYGKGALVALALDLTLRARSGSRLSLDDVMRELWLRFGRAETGVPEDGFEALVNELAGEPLDGFFDRAVRGTEDLPLAELLGEFAVELGFRPASGPDDKGGTPPADDAAAPPSLGVTWRARDGGLELITVIEGGAAQRGGLNPGDLLVAVDGLRVGNGNLRKRLARREPGERVRVALFRGDELLELGVDLSPAPLDTCYLRLAESADRAALARREAWLGAWESRLPVGPAAG